MEPAAPGLASFTIRVPAVVPSDSHSSAPSDPSLAMKNRVLFTTAGFSNAETNYAGSFGTHSLVSGNAHAVSQYDIACVGVTNAGH